MTVRPLLMLATVSLAAIGGAWAAGSAPAGADSSGASPPAAKPPPAEASWWITREQRAQRLLDTGRIAQAAQLFNDPRRRAYADARLGRDAEAARLLAPLRDPRSEYDRGNALARSGQLIGALSAYDAALAQAPDDRDARHNRDLVARVLASRAQRSGQGGGSRSGQRGQQGNQGQSRSGQSAGAQGQGSQSARSGRSGAQSGQSPAAGEATPEQEAEQAREDAALAEALRRRAARTGGSQSSSAGAARGAGQGGTGRAGGEADRDLPWPPPKSEQALALDQWLRRIPEDPGGLLRRKFLIEHMERQEQQP